jgi:hypothetical protein
MFLFLKNSCRSPHPYACALPPITALPKAYDYMKPDLTTKLLLYFIFFDTIIKIIILLYSAWKKFEDDFFIDGME